MGLTTEKVCNNNFDLIDRICTVDAQTKWILIVINVCLIVVKMSRQYYSYFMSFMKR